MNGGVGVGLCVVGGGGEGGDKIWIVGTFVELASMYFVHSGLQRCILC